MEMNEKIRLRRLRKTDLIRQLTAETNVNVNDLVYPIFIKEGRKIKEEITLNCDKNGVQYMFINRYKSIHYIIQYIYIYIYIYI